MCSSLKHLQQPGSPTHCELDRNDILGSAAKVSIEYLVTSQNNFDFTFIYLSIYVCDL